MMHIMNWDDLRFVAAVTRRGSLLAAARELRVEHTTVGRRIDAAEKALGAKLFSRSTTGFHLTVEGERLLDAFGAVEAAVSALERRASASRGELEGTVKVTSPETIGIAWLAPKLAALTKVLADELGPSGINVTVVHPGATRTEAYTDAVFAIAITLLVWLLAR